MKRLLVLGLALLALSFGGSLSAQTATPAGPTSNVSWFFTACADKAVIDLSGTMQSGFALYVQVFRETQASGAPLSDNVLVSVTGDYKVSRELIYPTGQVLATGQFASMRLSIAPTGNPAAPVYTTLVDDTFDVCSAPANPSTTTSGTTTSIGSTTTGSASNQPAPGTLISSSGVLKPNGGVLNPVFAAPLNEAVVQIGARTSKTERDQGRVTDVGLLFAECNQVSGAAPGRLYDTDPLTVFWSWYAKTPQQVQDHQAKAIYEVMFNAPGAPSQALPLNPTPIVRREGGRYWVFYVVELGSNWLPGGYSIDYRVTWTEPTNDGFADFGPGTETPELTGSCSWEIEPNPYGVQVNHRGLLLDKP